ncbi:MAG: hypothetical protein NVS9B12_10270 [Vulcanimicrobiaceae bacterium]
MEVRDLSKVPPRRWSEEVGGIKWLPRLIDKTRAALAGTLGMYLYGQSPMDRSLLRTLDLRYRDCTKIVANALSDDDVVRQIAMKSPAGIERARTWSRTLPRRQRLFLFVLDLDDGYLEGWYWKALRAPTSAAANAVSAAAKRIWPSRAGEWKES